MGLGACKLPGVNSGGENREGQSAARLGCSTLRVVAASPGGRGGVRPSTTVSNSAMLFC